MSTESEFCPKVASDPAFDRDTFLLQETVLTLSEEYDVCDENGMPILYVQRPVRQVLGYLALVAALTAFFVVFGTVMIARVRWIPRDAMSPFGMGLAMALGAVAAVLAAVMMRPKRHTTFYRDASKKEVVLRVAQKRRFQPIVAIFTVFDTAGQPLARLRKNRLSNFLRKRWDCLRPDGTLLCVALEQSHVLAILRLAMEQIFGYVPTNFLILQGDTDIRIGEFNRKLTVLKHMFSI